MFVPLKFEHISDYYFAVIEKFEQDAGRNPGETSSGDLQSVLELWKDMCKSNVSCRCLLFYPFKVDRIAFLSYVCCKLQSVEESLIPLGLLERLLVFTEEHPPVCAIIGGILGQVILL